MPRLVNGERKITTPKPENAGKLLIFCEGNTEYNYIKYFQENSVLSDRDVGTKSI